MNTSNLIYTLDSYKHLHGDMLPEGTEYVYSYGEARAGAMYDYTLFFGLQPIIIDWLLGEVVTKEKIDEAEPLLKEHFKFNGDVWSREKWDYIVKEHGGHLPIRIKAVEEGTIVSISNVLYTIENLDPKCAWLTNALETLIQQVWYPTTVATRAHLIMSIIKEYFEKTVDEENQWLAEYYLHSFGQRACANMGQAGVGGAAELISIRGTDTVMGMKFAIDYYDAKLEGLGYSVPASEHSIACSLGKGGEFEVVKNLIKRFPKGILSVVSDTYSIENAVNIYCTDLKEAILARDGKFVVRPDSPRFDGDTPEDQVLWIVQKLDASFGHSINKKGFKTLNPKVGVIYGDSLTERDIRNILQKLYENRYSAESCVYGCGSYLLDKLNRDTQRSAIKASAICINGKWYVIYKEPTDKSKVSKKGKLKLVWLNGEHAKIMTTVPESDPREDLLKTVYENGKLIRKFSFQEIRDRALK